MAPPDTASKGLFEVEKFSFDFEDVKRNTAGALLRSDGFSLDAGSIYSLIGANMSGKSTLLKLITGRIGDRRHPIDVQLGRRIFTLPRDYYALRVAGVRASHQNDTLFPELSILENILLGADGRKSRSALTQSLKKEINTLINGVEKSEEFHPAWKIDPRESLSTLSGGGRAIVRLLRTALFGNSVLLLDEPTVHLDPQNRKLFFSILHRLSPRSGAIVLVSHGIEDHQMFRYIFNDRPYGGFSLEKGVIMGLPEDFVDSVCVPPS